MHYYHLKLDEQTIELLLTHYGDNGKKKISKILNSMMKVIGVTYIILLSFLIKLKLYIKHMISVLIFQFGKIGFFIVFRIELGRL